MRARFAFVVLVALAVTMLRASRPAVAQDAGARTCWCFSWVHGPDHGRDCLPTPQRCEQDRRASGRDSTPCASSREPVCDRNGWIGGQHFRLPVR